MPLPPCEEVQGANGTSDEHTVRVCTEMRAQLISPVATGDVELHLEERCAYLREKAEKDISGTGNRICKGMGA